MKPPALPIASALASVVAGVFASPGFALTAITPNGTGANPVVRALSNYNFQSFDQLVGPPPPGFTYNLNTVHLDFVGNISSTTTPSKVSCVNGFGNCTVSSIEGGLNVEFTTSPSGLQTASFAQSVTTSPTTPFSVTQNTTKNFTATTPKTLNGLVQPVDISTPSDVRNYFRGNSPVILSLNSFFRTNFSAGVAVILPSDDTSKYDWSQLKLRYEYDLVSAQKVPGPLPILGAAAAFGYSRRLRSRLKRHQAPKPLA